MFLQLGKLILRFFNLYVQNVCKKLDDFKKPLDDNKNNGLITKIWGPVMWESIHCVAFGYPIEPTEEQKNNYKNFFKSLCYVLPCCECREHYTEHIHEDKIKLCNAVFESRDSLTKWLYDFHMCVNDSLGVIYDLSYEKIIFLPMKPSGYLKS